MFVVERMGYSRGLAMLLKGYNLAKLLSYFRHHIDISTSVYDKGDWHLTGYYGHPERQNRRMS